MNRTTRITSVALAAALLLAPAVTATEVAEDHRTIDFPELPAFTIERPEVYELDNGLKVFLMQDRELPLITVFARVRTGGNYMPVELAGMGSIFGQAQREGGTTEMTGDEMDDFLEARAASVETGMGGEFGSASMNSLSEDFDEVFPVFADVLRRPAFREDKIELARVQLKSGIARRNDSISGITSREFGRLMWGPDSPLAAMPEYETVARVDRDDLVAWHRTYYHPNSTYIGVVGDFDPKAIKKAIAAELGDWKPGPAAELRSPAYDTKNDSGVFFVEKTDVTQAYVRLGHLGLTVDHPDYFAAQVMNEVLGGGFSSRLFSNVRSKKGLAYSVFGGLGAGFVRPGFFQVGLSTKTETMAEAVDALHEEIRGIIENPPTAEEMAKAKESILNSFVFNYDSKGEVLSQQMTYAYYGLPADFLERYRDNIEKVTREQVAAVAKKHIKPERLKLLVVGNPAGFDRPVASFGEVAELDISIPEPPDTSAPVVKTADSLEAGEAILSRTAKTLTGADGSAIETIRIAARIAMKMGGQSMAASQQVTYELPDRIATTLSLPMGEQTIVVDGDRGAMSGMGRSAPLPPEAIRDTKQQMARELMLLVSHLGDPELEVVAVGEEQVDGTPCSVIAVDFRGSASRLWIDAEGRVLKQSYRGKHPMTRSPAEVEVSFSDYREVDGRLIPHRQVISYDGEPTIEMDVDSVEINSQLDAATFALPDAA